MRSNSKHTARELERYILLYLNEGKGFRELNEEYGLLLSQSTFGQKVLRYQDYGFPGIQTRTRNNHYTKAFKKKVIQEHLEEGTPFVFCNSEVHSFATKSTQCCHPIFSI